MDIKALIKEFNESEKKKEELLRGLKSLFSDEPKLWLELEKLNTDVLITAKVMNFVADILQMVNAPELLNSYDLQDIKDIYQILVKYHPHNIQYQIDLIAYINNVLGEEEEANILANRTIKFLDEKKLEIKKLFK